VAESAEVGVPHPDFGDGVVAVAVVVTRPGPARPGPAPRSTRRDDRPHQGQHRQLQGTQTSVRVGRPAPRNAMDKVQKNLLREQHKGLFAG